MITYTEPHPGEHAMTTDIEIRDWFADMAARSGWNALRGEDGPGTDVIIAATPTDIGLRLLIDALTENPQVMDAMLADRKIRATLRRARIRTRQSLFVKGMADPRPATRLDDSLDEEDL